MAKIYQLPARKAPDWHPLDNSVWMDRDASDGVVRAAWPVSEMLNSANREPPFREWLDSKLIAQLTDDRPDLYASEAIRGPEPKFDWIPILLGALVGLWVVAFIAGRVM